MSRQAGEVAQSQGGEAIFSNIACNQLLEQRRKEQDWLIADDRQQATWVHLQKARGSPQFHTVPDIHYVNVWCPDMTHMLIINVWLKLVEFCALK